MRDLPMFLTDLIDTQATTVAGTEAAGFLIERGQDGKNFRLMAHLRPDNSTRRSARPPSRHSPNSSRLVSPKARTARSNWATQPKSINPKSNIAW